MVAIFFNVFRTSGDLFFSAYIKTPMLISLVFILVSARFSCVGLNFLLDSHSLNVILLFTLFSFLYNSVAILLSRCFSR